MRKLLIIFCLLTFGVSQVLSQKFWSPREITLDTYGSPVPFKRGGEMCLAYELHITNMDSYPILIKQIKVYKNGSDVPFKTYSNELIKKSLSRIRVPGSNKNDSIVHPGQRALLHVMLNFKKNEKLPIKLSHQVLYSFIKVDKSEEKAVTKGGEIEIDMKNNALVLGAPLAEGLWLAARGVEDGYSGHRRGVIRPENGIAFQKARFAIDFGRINEEGDRYSGDRNDNANYFAYGSEVLAVADAQVETIQDNIPDSHPNDPDRLNNLTGETLAGNYVILNLGNNFYAFYGHLKQGSLLVRKGDRVKKGQIIGLLGNSGNSTEPHLHFGVNRDIPRGDGMPYVFERFEYLGAAPNTGFNMSDDIVDRLIKRLTKKSQGSQAADFPLSATIENSIKNIFTSSDSSSNAEIPKEGSQVLFEMPVSGSLIRFYRN